MTQLTRSQKITYKIMGGNDILAQGHETARCLWNYTRWCLIGYNEKLRRMRGDDWERFKRNQAYNRTGEKYPGNFTLQKELKDFWAAKNLSDRCFSYTIKDFDIAMRSWFSNLKTNPQARPPRYCKNLRVLNFEVGRNAKSVGNMTYRLTVLGGHIKERFATIRLRIKPGIKMADIKLIRLQSDGSGVVINYVESIQTTGKCIAAIDLGIINIATVAFDNGESIMVSGKAILAADQWANKQASKCKPKNWAKGKQQEGQSKRFKAYRRKAGNTRQLAVHNLTRHIINECIGRSVGTIVIGDLKGIREDADHGKAGNQRLHAWPFAEIKRQLEYKAEEVGIEVIAVSERNTSKCCHICGKVGQRKPRGMLTCRNCGMQIHSDVNGAFGILNKLYSHLVTKIDEIKSSALKIQNDLSQEVDNKKRSKLKKREVANIEKLLLYEKKLSQVSPSPVYAEQGAGVGVEAIFPGPPSPGRGAEICSQRSNDQRIGKAQSDKQFSQISPTFVAKFDLRNWTITQTRCS